MRRDKLVPAVERLATRINGGQIIVAITVALIVFWFLISLLSNRHFNWPLVAEFMLAESVLGGVGVTLTLTIVSQAVAIIGGAILALMMQSRNVVLRWVAALYIWFFRGTPLLVQLIFWYNLGLLVPRLGIDLPMVGLEMTWPTNDIITPFGAALVALSLNEVAYMTEIIRGGMIGVPKGQVEAALSVGASHGMALRRIILPQTVRIIIPPTGNQFIGLLKTSSLVSVIGGGDLLTVVQHIYGQSFQVIPMLTVACIWYLFMTTVASIGQYWLEYRMNPDNNRVRVS